MKPRLGSILIALFIAGTAAFCAYELWRHPEIAQIDDQRRTGQ